MNEGDVMVVEFVAELWPDLDVSVATVHHGMSHDVVVVPDQIAVRVARTTVAGTELRRSAALLAVLARSHLPFEVPRPLTTVVQHRGKALLATSFIRGAPRPRPDPGLNNPEVLPAILDAIAAVPLADLGPGLSSLRGFAGGPRWADLAQQYLLPRLTEPEAQLVARKIQAALALPTPEHPVLVHGDLAGTNLHWDGDRLIGVLDWDLAFAGDHAYDVACLADGFGWNTLQTVCDHDTIDRARTYRDVFLIEAYLAETQRGAARNAARLLQHLQHQITLGTTAPPTPP